MRVRAYLDSAMVARLFEKNPIGRGDGSRAFLVSRFPRRSLAYVHTVFAGQISASTRSATGSGS